MSTSTTDPARLLRTALRANAAFSIVSGAVMLFAPGAIADLLGLDVAPLVIATGVGLLGFAGFLLWLASRPNPPLGLAWTVIAGDLLWVTGTAFLVAANLLSTPGTWVVAGVADVVLVFAIVQWFGVRRLKSAEEPART